MAEEQLTVEAPVQEPVAPVPADPFALEESSLASLSPEQRASLDPILNTWRERAKQEIEKSGKSVEDRYAPLKERPKRLINSFNISHLFSGGNSSSGLPVKVKPLKFKRPSKGQSQLILRLQKNGRKRLLTLPTGTLRSCKRSIPE